MDSKLTMDMGMDLNVEVENLLDAKEALELGYTLFFDGEEVDDYEALRSKMRQHFEEESMVNSPNHYIGEYGLEVEEVLRNFIPRYKDAYVAHRVASALEYLLRAPEKNGIQDLEKARKNIDQALEYLDSKEEDTNT